MSAVKAIVLRSAGTNCDQESAHALSLAGAEPSVIHINRLLSKEVSLEPFSLMIIPGGFSYGDDVAAGKILANELRFKLRRSLDEFIAKGKRIIGICNGFQVLVKTGYLPGRQAGLPGPPKASLAGGGNPEHSQTVTLGANDSGQFQCHWVRMRREKSACRWLEDTDLNWELPIAHGEGKFVAKDARTLAALEKNGQIVFRYKGTNPNGSVNAIAGICSADGNVIGLMPHPERHVVLTQHPEWTRSTDNSKIPVGLQFFKAAVNN